MAKIVKIADEGEQPAVRPEADKSIADRVLEVIGGGSVAATGGYLAGLGGVGAFQLLDEKLNSSRRLTNPDLWGRPFYYDEAFGSDDVKKIQGFAKEQLGKRNVPIVSWPVAGYDSTNDLIGLADNSVPTAFHEIGHATRVSKRNIVNKAIDRAYFASMGTPGAIARAAAVAAYAIPEDKPAWAIPAILAASAPTLGEEARATYHAFRGGARHGVPIGRTIRSVAPAYGTYLAAYAGAPIIGAMLARTVLNSLRGSGRVALPVPGETPEKTAAAIRASGQLRASASSAWKAGVGAPKPKNRKPAKGSAVAKSTPKAQPPAKSSFYKDMLESLYNPSRGFRAAVGS